MKMYFSRWIRAVVLTASLLLFPSLVCADADNSHPQAENSTLKITTSTGSPAANAPIGRQVYFPISKLLTQPESVKLSFEIVNSDSDFVTYDMKRLSFNGLGIRCFIILNEDRFQFYDNVGLLQDFADQGVLYTNKTVSPAVNSGMLICPYDSDGNIIMSLVGTPIQEPKPHYMNGWFKVHSNPNVKVHKVHIINMPFTFTASLKDFIRNAQNANSNVPISLQVDCYVSIDASLNIENGCNNVLTFQHSETVNHFCYVHFDGRNVPAGGMKLEMVNGGKSIKVPAGYASWLDLYESTDLKDSNWIKTDLSNCTLQFALETMSKFPPSLEVTMNGLSTTESRKFYRLQTRE